MARQKHPASAVKDESPKQEPVSFDIAEAVESGRFGSLRSPQDGHEALEKDLPQGA